jgi:hypothetical protein
MDSNLIYFFFGGGGGFSGLKFLPKILLVKDKCREGRL